MKQMITCERLAILGYWRFLPSKDVLGSTWLNMMDNRSWLQENVYFLNRLFP